MNIERGFLAELQLFQILKKSCKDGEEISDDPNKLKIRYGERTYYPDFYLPNGCKALGLKPKTIIDVRLRMTFETLQQIRLIHNYYYPVIRQENYNLVFVFMQMKALPWKNEDQPLKGRISDDFQIISLDSLLKGNNENNLRIHISDADGHNKFVKDKAKIAIKSESCSFILGAGVSIDARLPNWETLLRGLVSQANKKYKLSLDENDYQHIFQDCGYSSIITGRLMHTLYKDNDKDFKSGIRKALYQDKEYRPGPLAESISRLIKYKYNHKSLTSVITYNYDDLIEKALNAEKVMNVPVFGNQQPGAYIPVYHVHGYMPQDDDPLSTIVLSEKDYHEIYKQAYHWSNVEQLHAMQRSVCFFIGLSMTDPNLRRLLDIAQGENSQGEIRHFAYLRRSDASKDLEGVKAEEFRIKVEIMLKGLGVAVIWYDEHTDLPILLNNLLDK